MVGIKVVQKCNTSTQSNSTQRFYLGTWLYTRDYCFALRLGTKEKCNGHYNRAPDLGKCVMWWNTWDLARYTILDARY